MSIITENDIKKADNITRIKYMIEIIKKKSEFRRSNG